MSGMDTNIKTGDVACTWATPKGVFTNVGHIWVSRLQRVTDMICQKLMETRVRLVINIPSTQAQGLHAGA